MLEGKFGVVFGVANHRSFAWHIAKALDGAGARLCLNYQMERFERNVRPLAEELANGPLVLPCDLSQEDQIAAFYSRVSEEFGRVDYVIHCVASAKTEDLDGRYVDTSRENWSYALEASAYSFVAAVRGALPLMADGGSAITLTYLGAERTLPNYNVMGVAKAALEASVRYMAVDLGPLNIRVNAISAGPVSTLAARGIRGFSSILELVRERSPLQRNTDQSEVADTALFLCSSLSRGVTGEVIHVDSGYHVVGM